MNDDAKPRSLLDELLWTPPIVLVLNQKGYDDLMAEAGISSKSADDLKARWPARPSRRTERKLWRLWNHVVKG